MRKIRNILPNMALIMFIVINLYSCASTNVANNVPLLGDPYSATYEELSGKYKCWGFNTLYLLQLKNDSTFTLVDTMWSCVRIDDTTKPYLDCMIQGSYAISQDSIIYHIKKYRSTLVVREIRKLAKWFLEPAIIRKQSDNIIINSGEFNLNFIKQPPTHAATDVVGR